MPLLIQAVPAGFLSLNCGGNAYHDPTTGIPWIPDSSFISSGSNSTVHLPLQNVSVPLRTLRYFPSHLPKYCYRLPNLTFNASYFLRASFLYGDYDGLKNSLPLSFVLLLDSDVWTPVQIDSATNSIFYEIYVTAQHTFIDVCLAPTSANQTPFISTLELRPLNRSMYRHALENNFALSTAYRTNWGAISSIDYRYPYDKYDRIWIHQSDTPLTSTTHPIAAGTNPENPPSQVMQTAFGNDSYVNLTFTFPLTGLNNVYLALYFAEIDGNVTRPGERVFDVFVTDNKWFSALDIFNLSHQQAYRTLELYSVDHSTVNNSLSVTLSQTANSTHGPLLGASEVLLFSQAPYQSGTLKADVDAVIHIQQAFGIQDRNTGDPCLPTEFAWNWLNCSTDIPPRITALFLANHSLGGSIPDLHALAKLEHLDLDNNHLTGSIPNYFGDLSNLKELFLQNNKLAGDIPQNLIQASMSGKLDLRLSGNPDLNCSGDPSVCLLSSSSPAPSPTISHAIQNSPRYNPQVGTPSPSKSAAAVLKCKSMYSGAQILGIVAFMASMLVADFSFV